MQSILDSFIAICVCIIIICIIAIYSNNMFITEAYEE